MAKMTKKQKTTTELTDAILTWDEDNKQLLDPHTAEKLARYLINYGYSRQVCRHEHLITYKGKTKRLADWAREYGISYYTLQSRIAIGWRIEDALTTPVDTGHRSGNCKPVHQIDEKGNIVYTYSSIREAADAMGCSYITLCACCKGKLKTVCGYKWEYAKKEKKSNKSKPWNGVGYTEFKSEQFNGGV